MLGEGKAGPANLRLGVFDAFAAVLVAAAECLAAAGLPPAALGDAVACLALAGASVPGELGAARRHPLPFRQTIVTTDAEAACEGAHGGSDGAIIVVGTGSIGWGIAGGRRYRVGGWGLPVSDEGSGAWLGLEVIRRVLWAHDGRIGWSPLLSEVMTRFEGDPHALVRWAASARPADYGGFAPLVIEHAGCGDPVAGELVRLAAGHIDQAGGAACRRRRRAHRAGRRSRRRDGAVSGAGNPQASGGAARRCAGRRAADRGQRGADTGRRGMTLVETELREAPDAVARQERALSAPLAELAARLRRDPPAVVLTCARGSSAHAATFAKHLIERYLGIPVAEAAPVVATAYRRDLRLDGHLFLAISQSGRSDDLIETAVSARGSGALTVAVVNDADSPLAASCDLVVPMGAGPERAVAATKSFVATLAALLRLVAAWRGDATLQGALDRLPGRLADATGLNWDLAADALVTARSLIAIGRGPTLAIAREAALKLKEVANLHAEAFSGAEFLHGPVALVGADYPLLMFVAPDETAPGMRRLAAALREKGAHLVCADPGDLAGNDSLPTLSADHPDADALCLIQSFYAMAPRLAAARGVDVDRPRHLQKVTRTR